MNNHTITFIGGGANGPSMQTAIDNARNTPSRATVPAGATWPFATLSVDSQTVEFRMVHIHKVVAPAEVKEVYLSKYGYLFFKATDSTKAFGFTTFKLSKLLGLLEERDYNLHPSCKQNYKIAKAFLAGSLIIFLAVFLTITILSALKPNGF